jgi:hypothetical protein
LQGAQQQAAVGQDLNAEQGGVSHGQAQASWQVFGQVNVGTSLTGLRALQNQAQGVDFRFDGALHHLAIAQTQFGCGFFDDQWQLALQVNGGRFGGEVGGFSPSDHA